MAYLEISHAPKIDLKYIADAYSEPCHTSTMERFVKIVNVQKLLTTFANAPP